MRKIIKNKNKNKGFTIVELIVVMAIIAILILIAVPAFTKYIDDANKTSEMGTSNTIYKASMAAVAEDYVSASHSTVVADEEVAEVAGEKQPIVKNIEDAVSGDVNLVIYGYAVDDVPTTGSDSSDAWEVYIPATTDNVADDQGDIVLIAPATDNVYVDGELTK